MKTYAIRLLATAMIAGKPRSPAEGIQMVSKEDRDRLIENKQAEDADADVEGDDGGADGLDANTVKQLKVIAKNEGASDEGNKAVLLASIRGRRGLFAESGIDIVPDDELRKLAAERQVDVAEDADTAAILASLKPAPAAD